VTEKLIFFQAENEDFDLKISLNLLVKDVGKIKVYDYSRTEKIY